MILLDSNVLIYASESGARYRSRATEVIVDAVSAAGAAVNNLWQNPRGVRRAMHPG